MRNVVMVPKERALLFQRLAAMPRFLDANFARLSESLAVKSFADGEFAPVEQCWHLADLERDGHAIRIRRLLEETDPVLPDFDGRRVAAERNYRSLELRHGIETFRVERLANVEKLRRVPESAWTRAGTQEGIGRITLCDLPALMESHDASHRIEIEAWFQARRASS